MAIEEILGINSLQDTAAQFVYYLILCVCMHAYVYIRNALIKFVQCM